MANIRKRTCTPCLFGEVIVAIYATPNPFLVNIMSGAKMGAAVAQWYCVGLQINFCRAIDPAPGAWFLLKKHLISLGCTQSMIALQCRIMA